MTQYLIAFDDGAMNFAKEELPDVAKAASAVVREAKKAGVWVFSAGLEHHDVVSVVATDGTVTRRPVSGEQGAPWRFCGRRRALAPGGARVGRQDCRSLPLCAGGLRAPTTAE